MYNLFVVAQRVKTWTVETRNERRNAQIVLRESADKIDFYRATRKSCETAGSPQDEPSLAYPRNWRRSWVRLYSRSMGIRRVTNCLATGRKSQQRILLSRFFPRWGLIRRVNHEKSRCVHAYLFPMHAVGTRSMQRTRRLTAPCLWFLMPRWQICRI